MSETEAQGELPRVFPPVAAVADEPTHLVRHQAAMSSLRSCKCRVQGGHRADQVRRELPACNYRWLIELVCHFSRRSNRIKHNVVSRPTKPEGQRQQYRESTQSVQTEPSPLTSSTENLDRVMKTPERASLPPTTTIPAVEGCHPMVQKRASALHLVEKVSSTALDHLYLQP